ncbi:septum formation initiator family protein [Chloroflexales bacterium ZM16-3]|nr:septum formation initiator family protein [Chloroflexales bacterium ZM16-3]
MKRKRDHATRRVLRRPVRRTYPAGSGVVFARLAAMARSGGRGLLSLTIGAVIVALIGLLIANFVGQVMQSARLDSQRVALQAEVDQIRVENKQLEGAVAYAESDVNIERIAREQLGYARDGDVVIFPQVAAPAPAASPPPDPVAAPVPAPVPNLRRWWDAFFPTS